MKDTSTTFAEARDEKIIKNLLVEANLPHEDIRDHLDNFLVAKQDNVIIGAVGLEVFNEFGLLRSLVVAPSCRGRGVGKMVYYRMIAYAHLLKIKELYLLTTTAEKFFTELGFAKIARENVPRPIQSTIEFQSLCPASAVCMTKKIDSEIHYYPKEILRLKTVISGAKMWGVALEKVMLTYFEVQPHTRFDTHKHESEQITFVLERELFFEIDHSTICVSAGDIIAIPSNAPHAAYTKEKYTRAVDAWSPIRREYRGWV